ncbi:MAG: serine hydroxymethyltransferase [Nitrospinota bacterium]|nr:MAG: serine hydroxymethyltransferase [Nitrospinota bacterium]
MRWLEKIDPEIYQLIKAEERRQYESIRLIPSENYTSAAVMEATGSVLTNKYSEGYPGKRYYEGQQYIDQIENIARERAKNLFKAEHANVQPYSGSPANMAVYYALLEPGDKIMGMSLPHGGHLTHGWKVSFSGRFYQSVQYTVSKETGRLDYDQIREMAKRERPKLIVSGATAYPREFDFKAFGEIAQEVGAYFLADIAHIAGLVVAGVHQSPIPYADAVTTTTHKTLRGPRGAMILCKASHANAIDRAVFPALQGGPHNHTTAAIAVALKEASSPDFIEYGKQIVRNAKVLAEALLEYGFSLITGGTDNHLILIDMTSKGVTGKQTAKALDRAGIVVNYNTVPFDPRKPFDPSGIRLGTPSVTSRGMKEEEMRLIARWINEVVQNIGDEERIQRIKNEVRELCHHFPPPGISL